MAQSDIGRRIRTAGAYGGFAGRRELAEAIETSPSTLQRIEAGTRTAKRAELLAIAEACEVPMWFIEGGWDGWQEESIDRLGRSAVSDVKSSGQTVGRAKGEAYEKQGRRRDAGGRGTRRADGTGG